MPYINQIAQIFNKIFMNCCIRRFQAQLVLIFRFQRLQSCVRIFIFALKKKKQEISSMKSENRI